MYDTFSAFGGIITTPRIMRDPETGVSKNFGFVSYDNFEASDLAIQCMNGQWLANKQIVVQYAYKKESQGERHGSQAERLLAAEMQAQGATLKPNTMFASSMSGAQTPMMPQMQPGMPQMATAMPQAPTMPMQGMPPPPPPMMGMPPPPPSSMR